MLKWAGGKRWLVPLIKKLWLHYNNNYRIVEPFAGGMAISLGLAPKKALLNDANQHLINFYQQIQLGFRLSRTFENNATFYYQKRNEFNKLIINNSFKTKKAANLFYFLIKTGFNGLCRFNNNGEFNVPFGQHRSINYNANFTDYKKLIKNWRFTAKDFAKLKLTPNDLIYADPPYDVEFTKYHAKDFTWQDQVRLANWLANHPGTIIASNQATSRIIELYSDLKFNIVKLLAPRAIACNGNRKPALEILAFKNVLNVDYKLFFKKLFK